MAQAAQGEPFKLLEIQLVYGRQVFCVGIGADGKLHPKFMHSPEPLDHAFIGVTQMLLQVVRIISVLTLQFTQVIADGWHQVDVILHHIPKHVIIAERIKVLHTVDTGINGNPSGGMIRVLGAAQVCGEA